MNDTDLPDLPADLLPDLLGPTPAADDTHLVRLRHALADRAATDGLLDLAYRRVDSPLGPLLLAAGPAGLVRVAFDVEDHDQVLDRLAARVGARILWAPARLDPVAVQLEQYFDHTRTTFDVPVDLQLARGFRRQVLEHLRRIPYGTVASYAAVAAAAGSPKAVRAVGTACATNPVPLVVPCHRVVRADGTLGGYLGGIEAKARLLELEAS